MKQTLNNGIGQLVKLSKQGNISISGIKGSGKDVMQGNIVARKKSRYVSNMDYTRDARYIPLNLTQFNMGGNTYENFISGNIAHYSYPYEDGVDVIISDAGVYLPSQYDSQLDKKYPYLATWGALQRQLNDGQFHFNSQNHGRVWKKLREQCCDHYIRCDKCIVILGIVIATYYYYDKESSLLSKVKPCRIRKPGFLASEEARMMYESHVNSFYNTYGTVEKHWYICINKSKHNSRVFKEMLENGKKQSLADR